MSVKLLLFLAVIICLVVILGGALLTREIMHDGKNEGVLANQFSLFDKVRQGISLLKSTPPLKYRTSNGGSDGSISGSEISLAILNVNTGEIVEKRFWITVGNKRSGAILDSISDEQSLRVRVEWWNSFNSVFSVLERPDLMVVANKYVVAKDYLPEQSLLALINDPPRGRYFDMVYTPYSSQIHQPELVEAGKDYIGKHISLALFDLRQRQIKSKLDPDSLVADSIDPNLVRYIILTEHVDPSALLTAVDGGKKLAERVLVILGSNQEWAYRYTSSTAGANGLAQFIESSYYAIDRAYPDAGLIKDFRLGMSDHTNATKAMILYLDIHKRIILDGVNGSNQFIIDDSMLAAAYNGGPSRTIHAINNRGAAWVTDDFLHPETYVYVLKFQTLQRLSLFD